MTPTQDMESYILFELGGTTCGVRSREVLQIEMLDQITPVPNSPPFVDGVVLSRGRVIPAVNLRVRFGFAREPHTLQTRLLVVQAGDHAVGLIVDSAREFRSIPSRVIHPPDAAVSGLGGKFLSGIATLDDRLVLLLHLLAVVELIGTDAPVEEEAAMTTQSGKS